MNASKVSTNTGRIFQLKEQIQNDLPTYEADISGLDIKQQLPLDYITLTQGTGLDVDICGNDFTLNDYNNMFIYKQRIDSNFTTNVPNNALAMFIQKRTNVELYDSPNTNDVRPQYSGNYLISAQIVVFRNTYVGPVTIQIRPRDAMSGLFSPQFLHLASDENIGIIHFAEVFANLPTINGQYRWNVSSKKTSDFKDGNNGIGIQANTGASFEYVGEWGLWELVAMNTANINALQTTTTNAETSITQQNKFDNPTDLSTYILDGVGIQGTRTGTNITLNDYQLIQTINTTDITPGVEYTILSANFGNITFLYSLQLTIIRTTYVGPFTIEISGTNTLATLRKGYLHFASNENSGTLIYGENLRFVPIFNNGTIRARIKKGNFFSNFSGVIFRGISQVRENFL